MKQKLLRSTSSVAGMTLLSRILGLVRDVILAQVFGAGAGFDAFVIAFKIPNFMRRLFAEGAFSQAFVPVLSEYREKRSPAEVREFISHVAGNLGLIVLLVVAVAELLVPLIVIVFAPGFLHDPIRFGLTRHMLHITFPYLIFITLTAFCGAVLNTFHKFSVPAFAPVLLNVSLISVAWWWAPHAHTPIYVLAWGALIGGVAQLLWQWPFLKRLQVLPWPRVCWRDPGVKRILKLMVPALFGVSVAQLGLLADNFFASFLPAGSISWLYYSDRLTYLPLGVIGVALATVVLPHLSRHHANQSKKHFSQTLDWALRCALLIGLPAAIGLFMLAGPLLVTLIHHGKFNNFDVIMTRRSLMAFAVGLPGFMGVKVLASAFYSQQNIKLPVKIAAVALLINIFLNLLLIHPLAHAGLALATSLAALFNAGVLFIQLLRHKMYQPQSGWALLGLRILLAAAAMVAILWWWPAPLTQWLTWSIAKTIGHLAVVIVFAALGYFAMLWITGWRFRDLAPPTGET